MVNQRNDQVLAEFVVLSGSDGERIDVATAKRTDLSRNAVQNYIANGQLECKRVGSLLDVQPDTTVLVGDQIIIKKPKKTRQKIPILYEDQAVIVFNKPQLMLAQPKSDSLDNEWTVLDELRQLAGSQAELAHRLDRGTSGVLIGAKSAETQKALQQQFAKREVDKAYLAICEGIIAEDGVTIEWPILRDPRNGRKYKVNSRGRVAVTEISKRIATSRYSAVLLKPKTGRTHQLRVHLAHLGHPIYGDKLYGSEETLPEERFMLHAYSIQLRLNAKKHSFVAPIPGDMRDLSQKIGIEIGELL